LCPIEIYQSRTQRQQCRTCPQPKQHQRTGNQPRPIQQRSQRQQEYVDEQQHQCAIGKQYALKGSTTPLAKVLLLLAQVGEAIAPKYNTTPHQLYRMVVDISQAQVEGSVAQQQPYKNNSGGDRHQGRIEDELDELTGLFNTHAGSPNTEIKRIPDLTAVLRSAVQTDRACQAWNPA